MCLPYLVKRVEGVEVVVVFNGHGVFVVHFDEGGAVALLNALGRDGVVMLQ